MALRNNSGEQITIDSRLTTTEVTNIRSNTTAMVGGAYAGVSALTNYVRNVTDSALEVLMDIAIGDICDFNEMNYRFMERLMYLNDNEVAITLKNIGANAAYNGDSTAMSTERMAPEYVKARNYIDNYAKNVTANELSLEDTTRVVGKGTNDYHNHGQLYYQTTNLYPDEDNTGQVQAWRLSGAMDATLYKTKQLFIENKINTIISRFHTKPNSPQDVGDIKSRYGLSHSRNLLTKSAEMGLGSYSVHGYDRPYCRVWTNHYQYDKLNKRIRPFYITDENGSTSVITLKDFHVWKRFEEEEAEWGWKSSKNDGWNYSVLNDNGIPNITPIYKGGGSMNIHTKQCMFSIENLAWQGFSPYAFEKNLSWEQRGPLGGRIMWFPPYGINFNETTSASWQAHTFIGRGEDVYTYTNTKRTGTLSFMLVVDHPSILDYSNWDSDWNTNKSDTDILRFLAGCEAKTTVDGTSQFTLRDIAKPTPLTDEYISPAHEEENLPAEPQNSEPEDNPDAIVISFAVFYPNNYAGFYDLPIPTSSKDEINPYAHESEVESMAYLLAGEGAQKEYDSTNTKHPKDTSLKFATLSSSNGPGYEMLANKGDREQTSSGITRDTNGYNYIQGTKYTWDSAKYNKNNGDENGYVDGGTNQRWFYRIDGRYCYEENSNSKDSKNYRYTNTYDQQLNKTDSYKDTKSFGLNCDASIVAKKLESLSENVTKESITYENTLVSFAEIAYVLAPSDIVKEKIKNNAYTLNNENENNVDLLQKLLGNYLKDKVVGEDDEKSEYEIEEINIKGVANSQGRTSATSLNDSRNSELANHRAQSVKVWLEQLLKQDVSITTNNNKNSIVEVNNNQDESQQDPKVGRRAEVRMYFKKSNATTLVSDGDQTEKYKDETGETYTDSANYIQGFTYSRTLNDGTKLYYNDADKDTENANQEWYQATSSGTPEMILFAYRDVYDRSNYGDFRLNKGEEDENGNKNGVMAQNGTDEVNRLRYDQEYHFFKYLETNEPMVFDSLKQKLRYFDPAFHAQSPESFNSRLTFLQQCLRQGPTVGASDKNATSANNLAFGRPPVCVLRLGDFFNCKIIIENMSISYDPLVWDLNTEGIGVQPMIATVNLSFYFTGGSDIRGAITRLQNAVSFNYYGNTSLYDNRADRVYRYYSQETNGTINHEIDSDRSRFYNPEIQNSGDF